MTSEDATSLNKKYLKIFLVVTAYWFISISTVFINKTLFSSKVFNLRAPLFVTWTQCLVSVVICLGWQLCTELFPTAFDFPSSKPFSARTIKTVLPVSILSVLTISFGNLSLSLVEVSFYFISRSLTTVFNVIFTFVILNQKTSLKALLCCFGVILGFSIGVDQENFVGSLSLQGTTLGVLSSISLSLSTIFTKKVLPAVNNKVILLSFYNNLYSLFLFLPLIILSGEVNQLREFNFSNIYFWLLTLIGGIFGFLIGFISNLQIKVTSPLTHNISGTAKACVQTVIATYCKHCLCKGQTIRNEPAELMMRSMSEKPVRPDDSDCCGAGCKPCVFDVYEERLRKWESNQKNLSNSKALHQLKYLPFLITDIKSLAECLLAFQFQAVTMKKENSNSVHIPKAELGVDFEILQEFLKIEMGEYLIMKGIHENETISRSYTPVLCEEDFRNGTFVVIVSLRANGKMSHFLQKLQVSDIVYWRGPYKEFTMDYKSFNHILLFGGGTGIVPLYNIAKAIVEDEESETWVRVTASFKTTDSIIMRSELRRLRDFWNFKMTIYITNEVQSNFTANHNEVVIFKRVDETVIKEEVTACEENKFLVIICGPEGFNHFVENSLKNLDVKDENIFIFW